jgi:hypothetical protein
MVDRSSTAGIPDFCGTLLERRIPIMQTLAVQIDLQVPQTRSLCRGRSGTLHPISLREGLWAIQSGRGFLLAELLGSTGRTSMSRVTEVFGALVAQPTVDSNGIVGQFSLVLRDVRVREVGPLCCRLDCVASSCESPRCNSVGDNVQEI